MNPDDRIDFSASDCVSDTTLGTVNIVSDDALLPDALLADEDVAEHEHPARTSRAAANAAVNAAKIAFLRRVAFSICLPFLCGCQVPIASSILAHCG